VGAFPTSLLNSGEPVPRTERVWRSVVPLTGHIVGRSPPFEGFDEPRRRSSDRNHRCDPGRGFDAEPRLNLERRDRRRRFAL